MKMAFSNPYISVATIADSTALVRLLNSAYRGEESKKGWTTEEHLITGDIRTSEKKLQELMQKENSTILKYTDDKQALIGCVNLQQHANKIYLGMLSVSPQLQGGGIGKHLLMAAEEYTEQSACAVIYMTVISLRTELISWYERHGYKDTGERRAFLEDGLAGHHVRPLEFIVMEKTIRNVQ